MRFARIRYFWENRRPLLVWRGLLSLVPIYVFLFATKWAFAGLTYRILGKVNQEGWRSLMEASTQERWILLIATFFGFACARYVWKFGRWMESEQRDEMKLILGRLDREMFEEWMREKTRERREAKLIQGAPGYRLRALAEFFFSPKVYQEIFEPTLRDLYDEYCEALNAGRPKKAAWVRVRGYWSFWSAFIAQLPISTVKIVYRIWKAIS